MITKKHKQKHLRNRTLLHSAYYTYTYLNKAGYVKEGELDCDDAAILI